MAQSDKDKGQGIDRDRKIKKLTKMIKTKEKELSIIEAKAERAKSQVASGSMSKGDYQRLNITLTRDRKAVRGAITRLEKGRLNRERKLKEKQLDKEERDRKREERRQQRALEKEQRKDVKDTSEGKAADDEPKKG